MKLVKDEKKGTEKPAFTPFDITLRVETAEEARLLWHVFNRYNLKDAIIKGEGYPMGSYDSRINNDLVGEGSAEIRSLIKSKVNI